MVVHVVRFFQRYAFFFFVTAGVIAPRLILPDDSNKWLKLAVAVVAMLAVWKLLYKDGVTGCRANDEPGLSVLSIIGFSVLYWYLILYAMLVFIILAGASATDWLPFGQNTDWLTPLATAALVLAAVVYAFGMRAAIRARRPVLD
jgi:hypothetical protein